MNTTMGKENIIRKLNEVKVICYLQKVKNATKNDIAIATKLSFPTVGKILQNLMETGEIKSQTFDESSGGRPAERFAINEFNSMVLALFIQEDSFEYQVSGSLKNIVEDKSIRVNPNDNAAEKLIDIIQRLLKKYPAIKAISLGVPCSINGGKLQFMPKRYEDLNGIALGEELHERFGMPVLLENDINAIALGQYKYKLSDKKARTAHLFIASDGMGMGITVDGCLLRGDNGVAGEVGFLPYAGGGNIWNAWSLAETEDMRSEVIANIVVTAAYMINPSYFSISGVHINGGLIPKIYEYANIYAGNIPLPKLAVVENIREVYFYSLIDSALSKLYSWDLVEK